MGKIYLTSYGWCNRCQQSFEVDFCKLVNNQGSKRRYFACPNCWMGLVQKVEIRDR
jgi:hypothetical protein